MPKNSQNTSSEALPEPHEVLASVITLRRKVYVGVYASVALALIACIPLGFSPVEIAIGVAASTLIAAAAIHLSFQRIIEISKRAAFPPILTSRVSEAPTVELAAARTMELVEHLLQPDTAFISLTAVGGGQQVLATFGMSGEAAQDRLERNRELVGTALEARYPMEVPSEVGDIHEVIVPISAGRKSEGVLYIGGRRGHPNLNDRYLLSHIGSALGIALEGVRSRELLLQKDSRLSSVINGAPVVLFAIDRTGVTTFMQGHGMERFGITPEQVVGRPADDVFSAYPQVLQSVRRSFAGEEITATITLGINEQQITYEYRLAPERDERGRVIGIIGVANDITDRRRALDALSESQRALETLVGNLPGFAYRCRNDTDWTMEYISDGIEDVTGFSAEEVLSGRPTFNELIYPDDRQMVWDQVQAAVENHDKYLLEYRVINRDGGTVWVWEHGQGIFDDDDGETVALEGFISDVTERKRAEHELLASEERYRDLFENARDAVYTYDRKGRLVESNERWAQMTGYTLEELRGINISGLVADEFHASSVEGLTKAFHGEGTPYEMEIVRKDGTQLPIEVAMRVVLDDSGKVKWIQGIARDVSDRRQAEDTIRRLAYNDPLTGLPNRALMEDRLNVALVHARREEKDLAVMFLDLDHFKVVNDTLGHSAGDRLLQSVARDLIATVKDVDTVARVGGDEFTIILPGLERIEEATEIADKILAALRRNRTIEDREFRTTGSIGITTFPGDGQDAATLLRNADTAMYRAKEHGRDNYQLYTPSMNDRVLERLSLENDLSHAIERDELVLYYQPIVDSQDGSLRGAEALLRWNHPERGKVPPDRFIAFAEETGQIVPIGEWVLRQACEQVRLWTEAGYNLPRMAVNLSARQLQKEDLVGRITQIIAETGVSPHSLQLEITEGAVLRDEDRIVAALTAIRRMGVGIALDDFGTGYSSLTYLKRFPVDAVKIDRSFVRDLERDANDAAIVSTVIAMAQNLRLKVIAEGVETETQLVFLRDRRCHEFQGYLVSAPVPPEEFEEFLRSPDAVPISGSGQRTHAA
jgi:diguanylate cyclase (GGDEF)-like protein/PAS domain S-box-containing protein